MITDFAGRICRAIIYKNQFDRFSETDILTENTLNGLREIGCYIIYSSNDRKFKRIYIWFVIRGMISLPKNMCIIS